MQSFMFATWCPPGDRGAVSRLVSRKEQVTSTFDGGAFRMDWCGVCLGAFSPVAMMLLFFLSCIVCIYVKRTGAASKKNSWQDNAVQQTLLFVWSSNEHMISNDD